MTLGGWYLLAPALLCSPLTTEVCIATVRGARVPRRPRCVVRFRWLPMGSASWSANALGYDATRDEIFLFAIPDALPAQPAEAEHVFVEVAAVGAVELRGLHGRGVGVLGVRHEDGVRHVHPIDERLHGRVVVHVRFHVDARVGVLLEPDFAARPPAVLDLVARHEMALRAVQRLPVFGDSDVDGAGHAAEGVGAEAYLIAHVPGVVTIANGAEERERCDAAHQHLVLDDPLRCLEALPGLRSTCHGVLT